MFAEQPSVKLCCQLCCNVFKDPVITTCGVSSWPPPSSLSSHLTGVTLRPMPLHDFLLGKSDELMPVRRSTPPPPPPFLLFRGKGCRGESVPELSSLSDEQYSVLI